MLYMINRSKVFLNMIMILKKVKCLLTNIGVYDLKTYKKTVPYCSCVYTLNKTSGK